MTRSELITKMAARLFGRRTRLITKNTEEVVRIILDSISDSLSKGDRIEIRGFGSFGLNYRPSRIGRNPKLGNIVTVPEKYVPHFKAGKELRDRVSNGIDKI